MSRSTSVMSEPGRTRGEGRGVHYKMLVAAAVEVRHGKPGTSQDKRKGDRYAGRVRLAVAADHSADSLCGFVESAAMHPEIPDHIPGLTVSDHSSNIPRNIAMVEARVGIAL